jgi:hypothetical protein
MSSRNSAGGSSNHGTHDCDHMEARRRIQPVTSAHEGYSFGLRRDANSNVGKSFSSHPPSPRLALIYLGFFIRQILLPAWMNDDASFATEMKPPYKFEQDCDSKWMPVCANSGR